MTASILPCFMYSVTELARPKMLGFPPSPRQIPHTIVDFPVPLAPTTTLSPGPGKISTLEYVLKTNYKTKWHCNSAFMHLSKTVTVHHCVDNALGYYCNSLLSWSCGHSTHILHPYSHTVPSHWSLEVHKTSPWHYTEFLPSTSITFLEDLA